MPALRASKTGGGSPDARSRRVAAALVAALVWSTLLVPTAHASPWLYGVTATPNPANVGDLVTINATAETYAFYYIAAAEYHVDDPNPIPGTGTPMYAVDGTFDEAIEDISGVLDTWNLSVGSHAICVLAEESAANGTWWSACGTVTLIISGAPPVASAGPDQSGAVGLPLTFDGSGSSDPDGWIITYHWEFGDGSEAYGSVVTHAYSGGGTYWVALTVWDNDLLFDVDIAMVTIAGAPPLADAGGPYAGRKSQAVGFDGTGSRDPDGSISTFDWEFGDGQQGSGPKPNHAYLTGGTFMVTLTVTDYDGLSASDTTTATIDDAPASPPGMTKARLTGLAFQDVSLQWTLSADDGTGEDDVVAYDIYLGTAYDPTGASYSLFASVPAGTSSFVHVGGGAAGTTAFFYQVRAREDNGRAIAAVDQAGKFSRFLAKGNQLVSVPFAQDDWSVGAVLQTISWTRARTFANIAGHGHNWHSNQNGKPWQDLVTLDGRMAIWVAVAEDGIWTVAGLVPRLTQIDLKVGWNFLGYPSFTAKTVSQLLAGIGYQTVEGYANDPPYYLKRLSPSDSMYAGNGFWIHVNQGATLLFTN